MCCVGVRSRKSVLRFCLVGVIPWYLLKCTLHATNDLTSAATSASYTHDMTIGLIIGRRHSCSMRRYNFLVLFVIRATVTRR